MDSIIVCNTGSDFLSKVSISDFSIENLPLDVGEKPIGPQGICTKSKTIYTANNYNNSISLINGETFKEESSIYIGPHPNDLAVLDKKIYISCAEGNTIVVYDIRENRTVIEIPTDRWPHNIEIYKEKKLVFISNLDSDSVLVIDGVTNKVIKSISTSEYPTKIKVSNDKKMLFVCESYMGEDRDGYIEVFSMETLKSLKRIKVGRSPIDIWDDGKMLFVCNLGDGNISRVLLKNLMEIDKIYVGGMPKNIIKYKNKIYITDYLRGKLIILDLKTRKIKVITLGKEPNAMTLF